jgi:5-hydroxyisourate hydrolase-like protein (transthyretin family)
MRTLLLGLLSLAVASSGSQPPATALTGRVITGTGAEARPVRRAKVTLSGAGLPDSRIADTDTTGAYRFDRVPAGDFKVRVEKPGFVTLEADAQASATLTMIRGGAIEGVIADSAGDPTWNVVVTALQPQADGKPKAIARTRTDDLGRYRLHSLAAGDYVVSADTDGYFLERMFLMPGEKRPGVTTAYYPAAGGVENARSVRVSAGRDVSAIDVTLTPARPFVDPSAPPPAPRSDRNGTGRIAGVVSDATTGRPIRTAELLLLPAPGQGPRITHWIRTDAQGRFEYTSLPAQRYTLQVQAQRYVTLEYGQKRPGETGTQIDLRDGEDFRADVKLPRASAIEGTLLDEFGDPAPGVLVQIARRTLVGGRYRIVPGGGPVPVPPSDDRGRYRVAAVPPGDYYVAALSGVYTESNDVGGFAPTYYPGTADAGGATPMSIALGGDAAATFALVPAKTVSIAGRIVDEAGQPMGRGTLWLATPDRLRRMDFNLARGRAAPDGTFLLRNVPSGSYTLQGFGAPVPPAVHKPGAQHGPLNYGALRFGWLPIDLGDADLDGVVLKVSDGRLLTGQIVLEDNAVVTPPKPDQVHITALPVEFDSAPVGGGPPPSETRADWTFEVRSMSGIRRVFASVASPNWMLRKITLNDRDITDTPLDFRTTDVAGVVVVITPKVTRVAGGVTDDRGPVADYAVVVFATDPTKWIERSRFVAVGRPTQQGRFTVAGLPPEDYLAIALPNVAGNEYMDPEFLQQLRASATSFTLGEGESKTLDLKLKRRP